MMNIAEWFIWEYQYSLGRKKNISNSFKEIEKEYEKYKQKVLKSIPNNYLKMHGKPMRRG